MKKISPMMLCLLAISAIARTYTVPLQMTELELSNGSPVSHSPSTHARVGGYARWVGGVESYAHEVLLKATLPAGLGPVKSARIRFSSAVTGSVIPRTIYAFAVGESWSGSPRYTDFDLKPWGRPLAAVQVPATANPVEGVLEGAGLAGAVESWRTGANANNGLVISGSFWNWSSWADLSGAVLELEEADEGIGAEGTLPRSSLGMKGSYSFARGNRIANWSFEQDDGSWDMSVYSSQEGPVGSFDPQSFAAHSGRKVFRQRSMCESSVTCSNVSGYNEHGIPVEGGKDYTLWWHWRGQARGAAPVVQFSATDDFSAPLSQVRLSGYDYKAESWRRERAELSAPAQARFARIILVDGSAGVPKWDEVFIDDVVLEDGRHGDYPEYTASVAFDDGINAPEQSHTLLEAEGESSLASEPCLSGMAIWSKSPVSIGARSFVSGGFGAVQGNSTFGDESRWYGGLFPLSAPALTTGARSGLNGRIYTTLNAGTESRIDGTPEPFVAGQCAPSQLSVNPGSQQMNYASGIHSLESGSYGSLSLGGTGVPAVLKLSAGRYDFSDLDFADDAEIEFDLSKGSVEIRTAGLKVGARVHMSMSGTRKPGAFVHWYSSQSTGLQIGEDALFLGVLESPKAGIVAGNRSLVHGALIAAQVAVGEDATVWLDPGLGQRDLGLWAVSGSANDSKGRPVRSGLSYADQHHGWEPVVDPLASANVWYDGSGAERPQAGGYAYARQTYVESEMGTPVKQSYGSGAAWHGLGASSGAVIVHDLQVPNEDPELQQNSVASENTPDLDQVLLPQSMYALSWSRSNTGERTLSWTDETGAVVQTASALGVMGDASQWSAQSSRWRISRMQVSQTGKAVKSLSPLDVIGNTETFAETYATGSRGESLGDWSAERGLSKTFLNEAGMARFSQLPDQKARGVASYVDYDSKGRTVSVGETGFEPTQAAAEELSSLGATRTESVRRFYGPEGYASALASYPFLSGLGTVLNTDLGGGSLSLEIALNPGTVQYGLTDLARRAVAHAYSYDSLGRLQTELSYVGAGSASKNYRLDYGYDSLGRTVSKSFYGCGLGASCPALSVQRTEYDPKGRPVRTVDGISGKVLERFEYGTLGSTVAKVTAEMMRTEVRANIKGWPVERTVSRPDGSLLWQQRTGYDSPVIPGLGSQSRLDGRISQNYEDHAVIAGAPLRVDNYDYAEDGTLQSQNVYEQGSVNRTVGGYPAQVSPVQNIDKHEGWDFDANGRMTGRRQSRGGTMDYVYAPGSYRLDHVEGGTNMGTAPGGGVRDLSAVGTLAYDSRGRLVRDASNYTEHLWGMDGILSSRRAGAQGWSRESYLYAPDGWRAVTALSGDQGWAGSVPASQVRVEITLGGEVYAEENQGINGAGAATSELTLFVMGQSGRIGRRTPDGQMQYYVRNGQGSVVALVDGQGQPVSALRYKAYGSQELLAYNSSYGMPEEQYTGKRISDVTGLYYFGARFYDPQLGIWLSRDKMREFYNPFGRSGDPVNHIDKDGNCEIVCMMIIGAAVGAVIGGGGDAAVQSYKRGDDWYKFNRTDWGEVGKAAFVGGVAGAAGAAGAWAVGGLAASATGATGLATGSGLAASMAGGAVTGLASGAVAGFAGYSAKIFAGNNFNDMDGWDAWDATNYTFWGGVSGMASGMVMSGLMYGMSDNFRLNTHKTVEDYGFVKGRHADVVKYDYSVGKPQRAIDYYSNRVMHYSEKYTYLNDKSTRGQAFPDMKSANIHERAFFAENINGSMGDFDPSGLFEAVDHEHTHILSNRLFIEQAMNNGQSSTNGIRSVVETQVYKYGLSVAQEHGYSKAMIDYLNRQVKWAPDWLVNLPLN